MMFGNKYQCDLCGYCVCSTFIIQNISLTIIDMNIPIEHYLTPITDTHILTSFIVMKKVKSSHYYFL